MYVVAPDQAGRVQCRVLYHVGGARTGKHWMYCKYLCSNFSIRWDKSVWNKRGGVNKTKVIKARICLEPHCTRQGADLGDTLHNGNGPISQMKVCVKTLQERQKSGAETWFRPPCMSCSNRCIVRIMSPSEASILVLSFTSVAAADSGKSSLPRYV